MFSAKINKAVIFCITAFILNACATQSAKSKYTGSVDNANNLLNLLDPSVKTEAEAFAKGEEALSEGKPDIALFYFVKTLQYNKKNIKALEKIAMIHSQEKHPELAQNIYQEIFSIDKTNPFANEKLGLYYLEKGNTAQAKDHLTQAIKHSNSRWESHNSLGVIADLEHNHAEAIIHYEAALGIQPNNPLLLNNLGYSYYLAGNEPKARELFNQALKLDNNFKRAINNLALIEVKHGDYASAAVLLNRVMPIHETFNTIGFLCMINEQYDTAEEYLRRAIDESPVYFPKAQENLNRLLALKSNSLRYQAPAQQSLEIDQNMESSNLSDSQEEIPSVKSANEWAKSNAKAQKNVEAKKSNPLSARTQGYVHAVDSPSKSTLPVVRDDTPVSNVKLESAELQ